MNNWIQRHALMVLLRNKTARVKDLRPESVESNLFSYHLDGLVRDGLIKKVARAEYALTTLGERSMGAMSTANNTYSEYIKTVFMLYAHADDSYLLFEWSRQPYLGRVGFVQDHLPLGRSLDEGLSEAMSDKLNSTATPRYKTSVLIKVENQGELVSHMNALVYEVDLDGITLPHESKNGTAYVGTLDAVHAMHSLEELFGVVEADGPIAEVTLKYL